MTPDNAPVDTSTPGELDGLPDVGGKQMTQVTIINADVMDWASGYDGLPFMALFSDPPYHLTSVTRRFSKGEPSHTKTARDIANRSTPHARQAAGFLNQAWDGTDESGQGIAFKPETWAALCQHLYPGAFGFSYASSRGWHRLAVAIEDAGNIIQPAIWIYGYASGFCKATRIDSQIDKKAGIERTEYEIDYDFLRRNPDSGASERGITNKGHYDGIEAAKRSLPATPLAKAWQNHRYGGQILSPSAEPIICFQKPYDGRPLDNIVATGAGSLNVGLGRIGNDGEQRIRTDTGPQNSTIPFNKSSAIKNVSDSWEQGRWPKNLLISHSASCLHVNGSWQCAPECVVRQMGEEYGDKSSGGGNKGGRNGTAFFGSGSNYNVDYGGDSGPITRYFYQPHFSYEVFEQLSTGKQVLYVVKPGDAEREAGLNGHEKTTRNRVNSGGLENEPRFAPVTKANNHPTLKSIEANRYLCSLLAPPKEYAPRRLLIPFAGVGSEICGAILSGQWEEIIAIEQSEQYCEIAQKRVDFWESVKEEVWNFGIDSVLSKYVRLPDIPEGQMKLFE